MTVARTPPRRPKLPTIDPEMQRWCSELEAELSGWPYVSSRPMFGLAAYYRRKSIFAAIPRTRAVETPFSLLVKLPDVRNDRLRQERGPGVGWHTFTLESDADIAAALRYLGRAYDKAAMPMKRSRRRRRR
jgi:hypothetical protein